MGPGTTDIDNLEIQLVKEFPQEDCPLIHRFTDSIYSREIFMRAGLCVTSKIHKTQHQFVILEGDVSVYSENEGVQRYKTGHVGITTPSTRRVLLVHKDTRWITFHAATEKTPEEVEDRIIEKHINPGLAYEKVLKLLST